MNRHVPPPDLDRREAATFAPRAQPDFLSARRHSARVRWIKRLLPASIILAVIAIGAVSILSRLQFTIDLPFDVGHLSLTGSRLTMELPKLSGFTEDQRGYSVTAKTASQDLTRRDVIDLTEIEARLELADKGWVSVAAQQGSFDTKKQFITLQDGVDLAMNGGYAGRLKDASVDVKAGSITTENPVEFTYLDGKLVADRLAVTDRGQRALFEGHVQLDFKPSQLPGSNKPPAEGASATSAPQPHGAAQPAPVAATPSRPAHAATPAPAADPAPAQPALQALDPALTQAPLSYAPLPPRRPVPVP